MSLPGVRNELKHTFLNHKYSKLMTGRTSSIPEFFVSLGLARASLLILADLIDNHIEIPLAPLMPRQEVTLRLSTKASSQEEANQALDILENQILDCQKHSRISLYETFAMVMGKKLV